MALRVGSIPQRRVETKELPTWFRPEYQTKHGLLYNNVNHRCTDLPSLITLGIHSKNSRFRFDPERVPRCQTILGGQTRPENQVRLTQNPSQKDIIL